MIGGWEGTAEFLTAPIPVAFLFFRMATSLFKQFRNRVYRDTFLNTDYFAEDGTYTPKGGQPRQITVSVVEEESPQLLDDNQTLIRSEEITIQVMKDPRARNSKGKLLGGIDVPKVGDKYLRPRDRDPLQVPFTFVREMRDGAETIWRLTFRRDLKGTQGIGS